MSLVGEVERIRLRCEIEELAEAPGMEEIFDRLAGRPYSCFLDSSLTMDRLGRYSFIGFDPHLVLTTRGCDCRWWRREGGPAATVENPLLALRRALDERVIDEGLPGLAPFLGGGMGYLSYELGRYIERLPGKAVDDLALPELCFAFYDRILTHDHTTGKIYLAALHQDNPGKVIEEARRELTRVIPEYPTGDIKTRPSFLSNFSRDQYIEAVKKVKEYIYAGDIYQANLTQRFEVELKEHPWTLYRRLRRLNAAPFSAYFNAVEAQICSSSPERYL